MSYTPRSRIIKPGFFMNERLAECSLLSRVLFAGLWTLADKEGRLECRPKLIRAHIFPYENEPPNITDLLAELQKGEFVQLYGPNETDYIFILGWFENQKPHWNETESELPEPPPLTLIDSNKALISPLVASSNKEKKKEKIKEKKKEKTDHKLVVEYFCERYQQRYDFPYDFQGAKDGKHISDLLKQWKLEGLRLLIDTLFESQDQFFENKGGRSIGVLKACTNKLAQEAKRKHSGLADLSPAAQATARNAMELLEEMGCNDQTDQRSLLE